MKQIWGHIKNIIANLLTRWYLIFIFILSYYFNLLLFIFIYIYTLPTPVASIWGRSK
jgi:hypothetical protein